MTRLAIVGVPRNEHTLVEAILQARVRGWEVALVDKRAALDACSAPAGAQLIALERSDAVVATDTLSDFSPDLVVSFSEFNLLLAAEIRGLLGLPGPSSGAVRRTRCKHATRQRLSEQCLTRAAFAVTTLADLDATLSRFEPPFVIKPASMTGSIGVHAVRHRDDVAAFKDRFVSWEAEAARDRAFVVESFLPGEEYSVEGICHGGSFHLITVTAKRTDGFPTFAETGHILPARDCPAVDFAGFIGRVTAALELDATPIHAEVKVHGGAIELIEIHARFGGDLIPLLIRKALGYDVFGAYYDSLLGKTPPAPQPSLAVAGVRFLHAGDLDAVIPSQLSGPVGYCLRVDAANPRGAERDADNIRVLNPRIGHVLFTAGGHDAAETFFAKLGPERRTTDAGRAA
ncbi:MAG: ATP-grasp domain-containing protein [Pseudomonadota bacterium]